MALVSAQTLIRRMFGKLEVFAPGESIPAADANDALDDLNMMMGSLALQPLTIPAIARQVFPITADLGIYTIGPGGDFDTSRPNRLTGAALLLNNDLSPVSVSTITRSGFVATVTTATDHGAESGQNVTISGATPAAYNGTYPVTVTGATTFTYVFQGAASSASGTMTALVESNASDVVEKPCPVITDDMRQWIQIKSLATTLFTSVYYNPTFFGGLGTIELWPIPTEDTNAIVLYRPLQLSSFSSLTAQYQLPDGCDEMIVYNLAIRRAPDYGKIPSDIVVEMAAKSLATFKRGNTKLSDLPIDPAFTHSKRGTYNIITDTGG